MAKARIPVVKSTEIPQPITNSIIEPNTTSQPLPQIEDNFIQDSTDFEVFTDPFMEMVDNQINNQQNDESLYKEEYLQNILKLSDDLCFQLDGIYIGGFAQNIKISLYDNIKKYKECL